MKKRILIVEDELLIARSIKKMLTPRYEIVGSALSYSEALTYITNEIIDLVLLDIQLIGDKTGVDVATYLNKETDIPFIFLTAQTNEEILEEILSLKPQAYVAKPIIKANLITAINLAFSRLQEKPDLLEIISGKRVYIFSKKELLYVKAEHVYCIFHTHEKEEMIRISLEQVVQKCSPTLVRINRNTAINPAHIESKTKNRVWVSGEEFAISKNYSANF